MHNESLEDKDKIFSKNVDRLGVMLGHLKWIMFISFFVLKLLDKMDIAWIWVFAPLWIPFAVGFAILLKEACALDKEKKNRKSNEQEK